MRSGRWILIVRRFGGPGRTWECARNVLKKHRLRNWKYQIDRQQPLHFVMLNRNLILSLTAAFLLYGVIFVSNRWSTIWTILKCYLTAPFNNWRRFVCTTVRVIFTSIHRRMAHHRHPPASIRSRIGYLPSQSVNFWQKAILSMGCSILSTCCFVPPSTLIITVLKDQFGRRLGLKRKDGRLQLWALHARFGARRPNRCLATGRALKVCYKIRKLHILSTDILCTKGWLVYFYYSMSK